MRVEQQHGKAEGLPITGQLKEPRWGRGCVSPTHLPDEAAAGGAPLRGVLQCGDEQQEGGGMQLLPCWLPEGGVEVHAAGQLLQPRLACGGSLRCLGGGVVGT